jgi:hypothetical protein
MSIAKLSDFKDKLKYGSRANLFNAAFTVPAGVTTALGTFGVENDGTFENASILCKSAAIPAMSVGIIEVPFRGKRIKIPGDRTWGDWTATFMSDDAHKLRTAFLAWTDYIRVIDKDEDALGASGDYYGTIDLSHYRNDGTVSRTYKLEQVFPTDVSAVDLSYDSTDSLEEFTVTFQYHYMTFAAPPAAA